MRQQALLPIGLLDIALGARRLDLLQPQYIIKRRRATSPYPYDSSLLLSGEGAARTAVVVGAIAGAVIGVVARCSGGH
jgi:hypothetical protein